jgi:hypothetical protein
MSAAAAVISTLSPTAAKMMPIKPCSPTRNLSTTCLMPVLTYCENG